MSSERAAQNRFLTAPIGRLFVTNALPMMVMMLMSGMLSVVDAAFLGHFVGPDALAAVSLVFPILMVTIALSTLVSGGMSSLLARQLGARQDNDATAVFAQAHGLALFVSMLLIAAFSTVAGLVIGQMSGGRADIAQMAYTYLAIMIFASPLQLLLSVHADAWRNEGHAGLIALLSVGVTFANIALNYLLIVSLDMGVAGSALGTAIAQGTGLALLVGLRCRGGGILRMSDLWTSRWIGGWRPILTLGAPVSLSFIGIALVSATVITTLRLTAGAGYVDGVVAYGIVTRILSFTFLPLMAVAMAAQSIVGHNIGAKLYRRSDVALRMALAVAFLYCAFVEVTLLIGHASIGGRFVSSPDVIGDVGRILVPMLSLYLFTGPVLVLALYFQAIGKPGRTAMLTLIKPFALSPLLLSALGFFGGSRAIWFAFPIADGIIVALALGVVIANQRHRDLSPGFGLSLGKQTP
ncbi:MAG: MATE family efflux transporter [Rhodobacterales bacterium]|nr:MATE family efflux transporter [Rhodobacterales bacterium]